MSQTSMLSGVDRDDPLRVYRGGRVWVRRGVMTSAVAVRGAVVVALGRTAEGLVDEADEVVDLRSGLLLPAFGDGHCHPIFGGLEAQGPDVAHATSVSRIQHALRDWADSHPGGDWIFAASYDPALVEGGSFDARWIDQVVPDRPVWLRAHDYHTAWCNTKALALAGITADTPDPPLGRIDRREDGSPKGTLREWGAVDLLLKVAPEPSREALDRALRTACEEQNGCGVTWMQDAWVDGGMHLPYCDLLSRGELSVRSNLAFRADSRYWRGQFDGFRRARQEVRDAGDAGLLDARTVKFFADGVIESGTGAMLDPYVDAGGGRGMEVWDHDELARAVTVADSLGFQVHIHAIGDRAVRNALDAIEAATLNNPGWDRRPVITHVQLVDSVDVERFADLGVIANIESFWIQRDPVMVRLTEPRLGEARSRRQYALADLREAGVMLSHGSDWPISSNNPVQAIGRAVTRKTDRGLPQGGWIPEERITVEDAIDMATRGSTVQGFTEGFRGTLDVGRHADMVLLERDITSIPPEDIARTPVLGTWLDGSNVFRR